MNQQTELLGDIADLEALLAEAKIKINALDWRPYHQTIASRHKVLGSYAKDILTQTATVMEGIGNAGLDAASGDREHLREAFQEAFAEEFSDAWSDLEDLAEEASSPCGRAESRADDANKLAREWAA